MTETKAPIEVDINGVELRGSADNDKFSDWQMLFDNVKRIGGDDPFNLILDSLSPEIKGLLKSHFSDMLIKELITLSGEEQDKCRTAAQKSIDRWKVCEESYIKLKKEQRDRWIKDLVLQASLTFPITRKLNLEPVSVALNDSPIEDELQLLI